MYSWRFSTLFIDLEAQIKLPYLTLILKRDGTLTLDLDYMLTVLKEQNTEVLISAIWLCKQ